MCESCEMHKATTEVVLDGVTFNVCDGCKPPMKENE